MWDAPIVLAAAWTLTAWLRGHLLTGFPWNLVGYVWVDTPAMLQTAALVGIYGLTFVTVLISAAPVLLWPAVRGLGRRGVQATLLANERTG